MSVTVARWRTGGTGCRASQPLCGAVGSRSSGGWSREWSLVYRVEWRELLGVSETRSTTRSSTTRSPASASRRGTDRRVRAPGAPFGADADCRRRPTRRLTSGARWERRGRGGRLNGDLYQQHYQQAGMSKQDRQAARDELDEDSIQPETSLRRARRAGAPCPPTSPEAVKRELLKIRNGSHTTGTCRAGQVHLRRLRRGRDPRVGDHVASSTSDQADGRPGALCDEGDPQGSADEARGTVMRGTSEARGWAVCLALRHPVRWRAAARRASSTKQDASRRMGHQRAEQDTVLDPLCDACSCARTPRRPTSVTKRCRGQRSHRRSPELRRAFGFERGRRTPAAPREESR